MSMTSTPGSTGVPHEYFLKRIALFGFSVGIWDLGIDSTPTVTNEAIQRPPDMLLESLKGGYVLWEGPGPADGPSASTELMEIKNEGLGNTTSLYTEYGGQKRTTQMYKVGKEGAARVPWWTTARTMVDFDGGQYKWQSSFLDDLTCIKENGTVVADFTRAKFLKVKDVGTIHIRIPMGKEMERLVIATCLISTKSTVAYLGFESGLLEQELPLFGLKCLEH